MLSALVSIMSVKFKERLLHKTLFSLGIGSGAGVQDSGEESIIKLLNTLHKPDANLCVFDVCANVGKYAKACIEHLAGGGASR